MVSSYRNGCMHITLTCQTLECYLLDHFRDNIQYFSIKTDVMGIHKNHLSEVTLINALKCVFMENCLN